MRTWIRRLLLVVLALAVASFIGYAFVPKPVGVDLAPVTRGLLRVTVDEDGKTRIRERFEVSSPLAGKMSRITLKAGDRVEAARTLLTVLEPTDPAFLDARAHAEAEARLREAEKGPPEAEQRLKEARLAYEFASRDVARHRGLVGQGVSAQQFEDMLLKEQTAQARLRAAELFRQMADFRLELARAAFVRMRERSPGEPNGSRLEVRAPIDGAVLRVFQESTTITTPGQKLIELGDPTDLECVIDVLSADAVKIRPGARAFLEHWGGPQPLNGRVRLVEPSGFLKISALGVEEQRVNVIIDLVDPPEQRRTLGDAYRVEARIVIWEEGDVLKVPASARFRHGDGWAVFVASGGYAVLQPIKAGESNGLEVQVLDGLEEGEQVVVHPSDKIKDGVKVQPR